MADSLLQYLLHQIRLNEKVKEIRDVCLEVDYYEGFEQALSDNVISQEEVDFFFFVQFGYGEGWDRHRETLSHYGNNRSSLKLIDFYPGIECIEDIYGIKAIVIKRFFHSIHRRVYEHLLPKKNILSP